MPNCFCLYPKGTTEATTLVSVDEAICKHMGWFDCIGFRVACGKSFSDIRAEFTGYVNENDRDAEYREYYLDMLKILDFLEANYTTDCWAEIGKH